jgi:hypothetical protein
MKCFSILVVFLLVVSEVFGQSDTKNHLVDANYSQWQFSDYDCLKKWSVTFENKTKQTITSITFRLIIEEKETEIIRYKKTHSVNVSLAPSEISPSPYFSFSQELCGFKYVSLKDHNWYVEVLGFK